jgi:signal peptidase II
LTYAKLVAVFASRVRAEELARVEPVRSRCGRQDVGQLAGELGVLRAARVPESKSVGNVGEAKHFFDSAVTVRAHDENRPGKIGRGRWDPHDDVVVELALLPMIHELVSTPAVANAIQERAEEECARQVLHRLVLPCLHASRIALLTKTAIMGRCRMRGHSVPGNAIRVALVKHRSMAKRLTSRLLILLFVLLLVGCDHASKGVAKAELESGGAREVIRGVVSLRYVENTDIAFNLLRWVPETIRFPGLLVIGALAVVALCFLLLRARRAACLPLVALILVTAGAVGNYLDRVFRGYVVDFVHLKHWPVFNIADVYVTLGGVFLGWWFFVKRREDPPIEQTRG